MFLVSEIVLVDDASEHLHLQKKLEDYVSALPILVKIIRDLNIFLFTYSLFNIDISLYSGLLHKRDVYSILFIKITKHFVKIFILPNFLSAK